MLQLNQIIITTEENMIVIKDPKTFYFDFDRPRNVEKNLKHEIEHMNL